MGGEMVNYYSYCVNKCQKIDGNGNRDMGKKQTKRINEIEFDPICCSPWIYLYNLNCILHLNSQIEFIKMSLSLSSGNGSGDVVL